MTVTLRRWVEHTPLTHLVSRTVGKAEPKKILISTGFGAAWSTRGMGYDNPLMLTHPGMIAAIERGERMTDTHPAYIEFCVASEEECYDIPYGMPNTVVEVDGPFIVDEYDGSESVRTLSSFLERATVL